jgi:chaperonin GroEL (HSP60 family)
VIESKVFCNLLRVKRVFALMISRITNSLESIPLTLAENSGMDPIDTQVEIRAKHGQGKT